MPSKKKNASSNVSALTKQAAIAKFANGTASDASSPRVQSPDLLPESPPKPLPNGTTTTSPVLSALAAAPFAPASPSPAKPSQHHIAADGFLSTVGVGGASAAGSPAASATHPNLGSSPGNLISIMGESPPTMPSSYEDARAVPGWAAAAAVNQYRSPHHQQHRSPPSHGSPLVSVSPPAAGTRRPLSYHPFDSTVGATASAPRRSSMHAQVGMRPRMTQPPLPHQQQAHFYGAPDPFDLDMQQAAQNGVQAGEKGYYFGFDTIVPNRAEQRGARKKGQAVALAGFEGGLNVYSVRQRGVYPIASLRRLRGGVYNAKILPWVVSGPAAAGFPYVAVVVHGPVLSSPPESAAAQGEYGDVAGDGQGSRGARTITAYQTTVEIYSLRTLEPAGVLLEAPPTPIKMPVTNPAFRPPPPLGAFHLRADAGNLVVASGTTGECWIFRQFVNTQTQYPEIRCVAKVWTALQQPLKGDSATGQEPADGPRHQPLSRHDGRMPIISLNGRWLAYCPPQPSTQLTLRVTVNVPLHLKAPGVSTSTPPQLPNGSAELDLPIAEGVMNKIMRETTQEVIQGAKWVGQQGLQAWNNYWNKGNSLPPPSPARSPPPTNQPWASPYGGRNDVAGGQFPPTHGTPGQAVVKDPGLVSIIDINTLGNSSAIHPIATFAPPLGCSFLSFAPSGLALFTASTKGDVQTLWSLMRIQHTRSSQLPPPTISGAAASSAAAGSRIRQVAQFSRMTVARIVEVVWARPGGLSLAMVTERGTAHTLELNPGTFDWPPPRRRGPTVSGSEHGGPSVAEQGAATTATSAAVSVATNVVGAAYSVARPLIGRRRRSSTNGATADAMGGGASAPGTSASSTSTAAGFVDTASHGGRVIAGAISNSLGRTGNAISQLRNSSGDHHRVALPPTSLVPTAGCVTWGRGKGALFVLGDGLVRSYPSRGTRHVSGDTVVARDAHGRLARVPVRPGRYRDFKIPPLPDDTLAPAVRAWLDPDEFLNLSGRDEAADDGSAGRPLVLGSDRGAAAAERLAPLPVDAQQCVPQAEIESSAPYQPFHTDRRVSIWELEVGDSSTHPQQKADTAQPTPPPGLGLDLPSVSVMLADEQVAERVPDPPVYLAPPTAAAKKKKKKGSNPDASLFRAPAPAAVAPEPTPVNDDPFSFAATASHSDTASSAATSQPTTRSQTPAPSTAAPGPTPGTEVATSTAPWAFGQPIPALRLDLGHPPPDFNVSFPNLGSVALPAEAMETVYYVGSGDDRGGPAEQIVVTTRRRKLAGLVGGRPGASVSGGGLGDADADRGVGFFEDDCDVLDFADQRV